MAKASTKTKKATAKKPTPVKKAKVVAKAPVKMTAKVQPKASAKAPVKTAEKAQPVQKAEKVEVKSNSTSTQAKAALSKESAKKPEKVAAEALGEKAAVAAAPVPAVEEQIPESQQDSTPAELKTLYKKISQAGNNWDNVHKLASKVLKAKSYKMSEKFEAKTPILHKLLGWGYILSSENNRIQVLFKEGVKTLITNYSK
jgi:hypothetical protein